MEKELAALAVVSGLLRSDVEAIVRECVDLLMEKQADYGAENINAFGENGVIIRSGDCQRRLERFMKTGRYPKCDKVEDIWKDLANFAIIGMLLRRGKWPK